jgi:hypothetical protein
LEVGVNFLNLEVGVNFLNLEVVVGLPKQVGEVNLNSLAVEVVMKVLISLKVEVAKFENY